MVLDAIRYAVTVLSFVLFAGIVAWALSPRNRAAFDEARQLPFLDSGDPQ
ncbi:MAG: cbb3-type cytochrome c oxidase subunit 3 [Burkholderiales bacterium]|jgi:cytochrome c oxidase cbb3-type subunit 4|nr:cbb3-type cytochrome c oxidase subunit 3 [Burkholderiales bacterium]